MCSVCHPHLVNNIEAVNNGVGFISCHWMFGCLVRMAGVNPPMDHAELVQQGPIWTQFGGLQTRAGLSSIIYDSIAVARLARPAPLLL